MNYVGPGENYTAACRVECLYDFSFVSPPIKSK